MTVVAGVLLLGFGLAGFFFAMWRFTKLKENELRDSLEYYLKKYEEQEVYVKALKEELKVKSENRKEADEKINALHTGDALGNALDGLHKHKG